MVGPSPSPGRAPSGLCEKGLSLRWSIGPVLSTPRGIHLHSLSAHQHDNVGLVYHVTFFVVTWWMVTCVPLYRWPESQSADSVPLCAPLLQVLSLHPPPPPHRRLLISVFSTLTPNPTLPTLSVLPKHTMYLIGSYPPTTSPYPSSSRQFWQQVS